jgi:hypothetical protein
MEFQERFATEEACREYLFASRYPKGSCVRVAAASGRAARHVGIWWVCTAGGLQTSVTAGTVMHGPGSTGPRNSAW